MIKWKLHSLKAEAAMSGNKMTQEGIAEACGLHISTVQRAVSGKANAIIFENADRLLSLFSVILGRELTMDDLFEYRRDETAWMDYNEELDAIICLGCNGAEVMSGRIEHAADCVYRKGE